IFRPLARQDDAAALAFRRIEIDVDVITDFNLNVTLAVGEFLDGNLSFGFITDIDQHMSRRDTDDPALNDSAGLNGAQALLEHRLEFTGATFGRALLFFVLFSHANQLRSI